MNSDVPLKPERNWRVIAQELAAEHDSRRVLELSKELSAAIEPRTFNDRRHPGTHHTNGANYYQSLQNSVHTPSLLRSAIEVSAADFGNVQLFDPANRALRIVAQSGFGEEFLSYFEIVSFEDDCACAAAMRERSRMLVSDVTTDLVFGLGDSRNVLLRANVRSVQSTPLVSTSGKLIGMLSTHYRRVDGPTTIVWKPMDDLAAAFVSQVEVPEMV
jgi:hypothetical protein